MSKYVPESPPMSVDRILSEWLFRELMRISSEIGILGERTEIIFASAPPTTGAHLLGEIVFNDGTVTTIATTDHWRCSVSGTPGTWIAKV